jgi:uncharacterized protein (TIGR03382 family)
VTPTAASELTGSFAVTTDIPGQTPRSISLSAIGLPDGITPTPTAMDLGTVSVGAASPGQMLVLTNCSAAPLTLIESLIGGPNQDDFEIAVPPTTTTIAPGMAATYVIVTRPNNPGGLSATLQIRHDGGMVEVPLTAAGTGDVIDDRIPEDSTYYSCSAGGGSAAAVWPLGVAVVLVMRRRRRRAP